MPIPPALRQKIAVILAEKKKQNGGLPSNPLTPTLPKVATVPSVPKAPVAVFNQGEKELDKGNFFHIKKKLKAI